MKSTNPPSSSSGSAARATFLQRVGHAAVRGRAYRVDVEHDIPANVGYVGAQGDSAERFAEELQNVGARPFLVSSRDEARRVARTLLNQAHARLALCWEHPVLERFGISELLRELGVEIVPTARRHDETGIQQMFAADVGISSVDWAIAETGTLALGAAPGQEPAVSLLPPIHLAIVEEKQIVPDLFDLFAKLEATSLPFNLALITGPSKTGDIELKLTTGVHGPGEVYVIILRDAKPA